MRQRSSRRGRPRPNSRTDDTIPDIITREDVASSHERPDGLEKSLSADQNCINVNSNRDSATLGLIERRTRSESDCEATVAFPGNSAGSSSNSSLSTRSLDSPSTSLEQVHPANAGHHTSNSWDSDVDVEPDPPDWSHGVAEEVLSNLSNSEKKRQEVINELFHTERSHVRALKVLSYVFHKPLLESQVLPLDQVQLLFSNLDEMVTIHSRFNQAMKRKKKENPCVGDVGELILEMFDGENGEAFERAASTYCAKQQVALDALRDRRRKDPKLNSFLNEIEANPLCRRLQLKDHILTGMLRLTKYPLLFENLAKYTPNSCEKEKAAVLRAVERSKEILSLVNQAVREAEDCQRLTEILRMIDRSAFDKFDHPAVQEFKNLDITKRNLIFEGPLQWRIVSRPKPVDLHVVLLDDTILLLHRQDDKYILKFTSTNPANSVLSPIFKMSTVLVRNNAVDKNSLFLVNTSQKGAQIYDLVASSPAERKLWCKHISEAAEAYKTRNLEGRRPSPPTVLNEEPSPPPEVPLNMDANAPDKKESDKAATQESATKDNDVQKEQSPISTETTTTNTQPEEPPETPATEESPKSKLEEPSQSDQNQDQQPPPQQQQPSSSGPSSGIGESMRLVTCTQCSLIDPVEVHAEVRPVHVAEPVLTPIESLRRKDEVIKQALEEKQSLVADILNIPKEDFEHVADIASEPSAVEKEPAELILAAISQANQLVGILNSALAVTETEAVLATRGTNATASTGCDAAGCPVPRSHPHPHQPVIPVVTLQPICHSLTTQLSQLLKIVKERDEERDRLRKELRRSRERLHAIDADAQRKDREQYQFSTSTTQTPTDLGDHISADATEDINKEEFVDACGDPDVELETNDNKKNTTATEMMGDSVG
ncbi:hypothetical protein KQX54_000848 [Cotesia glomerata]|uniref:DH domain-containing protein n=1 Tax=Cotesia glomerata TaxID=32391 RepID=A0AAV7ITQ0_COTGL|nr:hypothetical protein KQX54_000848 [Cotesia glomerata]